ncbi:MAG: Ig-like domain-containing protein [Caulobacteraceae bacterium]
MSKKILAVLLAFALMFSTVSTVFAAETTAIGNDAETLKTIGVLQGSGNGVTPEYLATKPDRLQAATMFLRLKGLEEEALAFTGTDNFADGNIAWAGGKAIMAYLKAHPELGWVGIGGNNFAPYLKIEADQYYKVMLEALGYKQNSSAVVGDFSWSEVMTFAASKGLTALAGNTNFTVNDFAIGTVEALKANVKGTSKSLAATLVEAGIINRDAAISTGLYADSTTAAVDSVKAIANDKVEVTFNADVAKAFAENASNYKIVVKGSATALEVKSAAAESSTVVVLTTAAQTAGTAYTLTVGDIALNFAGIAKEAGAPQIDSVKSIDTNTIQVVFTKAMDKASAENIANYTLDKGAAVAKAELWTAQDDSRKTVKLSTTGLNTNNIYKLTIQNVKSSDMVAISTVTKSLSATADTKAPVVSGNVIVKNNQRIVLNFSDAHGIDKATAENIANYSIDNGLAITKVTAIDSDSDDYGYYDQIEISTEPMAINTRYTLTINNLADGSVSKNVISKAITKQFGGVAADTTAPKAGAIKVYGDSMVEIPFTDINRMDAATLTDINNYTFDNGLQVLKAEIVRPTKPDTDLGKTVVLTTSTMDTSTTYKITIANIADEFGNVMATVSNRSIPRSQGPDIKPPAVTKVVWNSLTEVQLTFDERLDVASANDPSNYVINNNLGAVLKAEVSASSDYKVVTLTTAKQAENKNYTVTINGVKDRLGNATINAKAYFTSQVDGADTTAPTIENIYAANNRQIMITFNEPVVATPAVGPAVNMTIDGSAITASVVGVVDDETTVVLKTSADLNTTDELTIATLAGIKDKHNNAFVVDNDNKPTFYGSDTAADKVEVSTKDQVDVRTLRFTFTGPIKLADGSMAGTITAANGTVFDAYVDEDADTTTTPTSNEELSTLTLVKQGAGVLPMDTTYKFDFSASLKDYLGNAVVDEEIDYAGYTAYTTMLEDTDAPSIDYVEAVSNNTINVVYTEDMSTTGSYEIRKSDGTASGATISAAIDKDNKNIVKLTLGGTALKAGDVYTLIPKTGAKDIAGNVSSVKDVTFDFVASAVVNSDYIKGVAIIDGRTIEVRTTKSVSSDVITVKDKNDNAIQINPTPAVNGTSIRISLNAPLLSGQTYTVTVDGLGSYSFKGILADGGIDVTDNNVTFSGWNTTDYVVTVVYGGTTYYGKVVGSDISIATLYTNAGATVEAGTFSTVVGDNNYIVEVYRANGTAPIYGAQILQ